MLKPLSTNALYLFISDAGARLLGFLATVHIARSLENEYFGLIILAMSVLGYAQWFADMGLTTLGTRELARPFPLRSFQLSDILIIRLILALLVFSVVQVALFALPLSPPLKLLIRLYTLFLLVDSFLLEWYCRAIQKYQALAISRWLSGLIYLGGIFIWVHSPVDFYRVPLIYLSGQLVGALSLFFWKKEEDKILSKPIRPFSWLNILKSAFQIGIASILAQSIHLLPPLILGSLSTTGNVGLYGAAFKIILIIQVIDRIFGALFLPKISQQWALKSQRLPENLNLTLHLGIWFTLSVGVLLYFFAPSIVDLIYGAKYQESTLLLRILSFFIPLAITNSIFTFTLIAAGRERPYLQAMMRGSSVAVLLITGFTLWAGAWGTALGVVLGEAAIVFFVYRQFSQLVSLPSQNLLLKALIYTATFVGVGQLLPAFPIWSAPILWCIFLGGVFFIGDLEWRKIKGLFIE